MGIKQITIHVQAVLILMVLYGDATSVKICLMICTGVLIVNLEKMLLEIGVVKLVWFKG